MPRKGEYIVDRAEILRLAAEGYRPREIARRVGTGLSNVYRHLNMRDDRSPAAMDRPAERGEGPSAAAEGTCAKCTHRAVCRLADDRRRAYEALGRAVAALPEGLMAEYRVRCMHFTAEAAGMEVENHGHASC